MTEHQQKQSQVELSSTSFTKASENNNTFSKNVNFASNTFTKQRWRYEPYTSRVKLFIKDILNLKSVQPMSGIDLFYYGKSNRPIQSVDVIGIIRAIDVIKQKVVKYYLDDGTSTIACITYVPENKSQGTSSFTHMSSFLSKFKISELVRVVGIISEYDHQKQIKIRQINKIEDPNEELIRWTDVIYLKKNVYCREFDVPSHCFKEKKLSFDATYTHHPQPPLTTPMSLNGGGDGTTRSSNTSRSASALRQYDEKTLSNHIKKYISENKLNEFRFSRIAEVPGLQLIAIKILRSQGKGIFNSKKRVKTIQEENKQCRTIVRNLFKETLKSLVQENYLQSDQNLITFAVVKKRD